MRPVYVCVWFSAVCIVWEGRIQEEPIWNWRYSIREFKSDRSLTVGSSRYSTERWWFYWEGATVSPFHRLTKSWRAVRINPQPFWSPISINHQPVCQYLAQILSILKVHPVRLNFSVKMIVHVHKQGYSYATTPLTETNWLSDIWSITVAEPAVGWTIRTSQYCPWSLLFSRLQFY